MKFSLSEVFFNIEFPYIRTINLSLYFCDDLNYCRYCDKMTESYSQYKNSF